MRDAPTCAELFSCSVNGDNRDHAGTPWGQGSLGTCYAGR